MDEIAITKKLALEIYSYLGTQPAKQVNLIYNQLAIAIDKAQKVRASVPTENSENIPEKGKE